MPPPLVGLNILRAAEARHEGAGVAQRGELVGEIIGGAGAAFEHGTAGELLTRLE